MKMRHIVVSLGIVIFLAACGDKKSDSAADTTESPTATTPLAAGALPTGGKVIKAMHAGGYTYMELESAGQQFWVASTMMNVKRNDQVAWHDAAIMKNFKSAALHRTFDEILFVSSATVQ